MSTSSDDSDNNQVTHVLGRGKKKGKSKLRDHQSASSPRRYSHDLAKSEPTLIESTTSRWRARDGSSSRGFGEATNGHEESRFESRFNASALDPSTAGILHIDSSHASSSSTRIDEDEVSDGEDLLDVKDSPSDNSPYAQVRASVAATDNLSLSIDTPRMWFLSILFSIAGSSTNLFFSLRYPSVSLTPIIALLLVHPLGLLWDQSFKRSDDPDQIFVDGCLQQSSQTNQPKATWKRRLRLWLAQGSWNEKEHCCVYVSSNVSFGFAFATDVGTLFSNCKVRMLISMQVIVEQVKFYKQDLGVMYQILLILSTQILGYSLAGITRRYLVRPSGMIWPAILVPTAMFTALHNEENKPADGWTISPRKFFRTHVSWLCCILLPTWPPLPCLELLQYHYLVCAKERCRCQSWYV